MVKWVIIGLLTFLADLFLIPFFIIYELPFWVFVLLIFLNIFLYVVFKQNRKSKEAEKRAKEYLAQLEAKRTAERYARDKKNRDACIDVWPFPSETFYLRCVNNSINSMSLSSEYSITKAKLIAEEILRENDITLENGRNYLLPYRLVKYYSEGQRRNEVTMQLEMIASKKPTTAQLSAPEQLIVNRNTSLSNLLGIEKRRRMYDFKIEDYTAKLEAANQEKNKVLGLSSSTLGLTQKESSWAIMGGIAEGIAGPAAGVSAAVNTMSRNAQIRANNEALTSSAIQYTMSALPPINAKIKMYTDEIETLKSKKADVWIKYVASKPSADEIWQNFTVSPAIFSKTDSGALKASISLQQKSCLSIDVPSAVTMVVDGTIKGTVWYENVFLDTVYFPLPLAGFNCNSMSKFDLETICPISVPASSNSYTLKLEEKQNLWVMES